MDEKPWLKNYDKGVPLQIDYPNVPVFNFLEVSARKYAEAPCTIFKGAKISFKEMDEVTDRLAAGLAGLGVKKGDRVGIFMPNTPQFVMAYFAILKAGGVVVATNPLYTAREIEHQVNDAGIEVMLVMSNFYNTIKQVQAKTRIRACVVTNSERNPASHPVVSLHIDPREKRWISHTACRGRCLDAGSNQPAQTRRSPET